MNCPDGLSGIIEQMFESLERGLASLRTIDLAAVSPAEIGCGITKMSALIDGLAAERARWIAAFDREQLFAQSGDTSMTGWLRNNCHLSGGSADGQVQLARQLPQLQETQQALAAGEIGIEHAVEIARATRDLGVGAEGELVAAAKEKDPVEVREKAREIRHRVDADAMARLAQEQYRRGRLRVFNLTDGTVGVDGALPPEGGVALKLCLESLAGIPAKDDERSAEQRHADALMQLCKRQLDSGRLPSVGGRKPHLTVVVQAESLAHVPGAPAPVLAARDKHCQFRGCTMPARFCEAHHLEFWIDGGRTMVKRMVLTCGRHHTLVHEGGWKL